MITKGLGPRSAEPSSRSDVDLRAVTRHDVVPPWCRQSPASVETATECSKEHLRIRKSRKCVCAWNWLKSYLKQCQLHQITLLSFFGVLHLHHVQALLLWSIHLEDDYTTRSSLELHGTCWVLVLGLAIKKWRDGKHPGMGQNDWRLTLDSPV